MSACRIAGFLFASAGVLLGAFAAPCPYGVSAHLTRSTESAEKTACLCHEVGIGAVRTSVSPLDRAAKVWPILSSNGIEYVGLLNSAAVKRDLAKKKFSERTVDAWAELVRMTATEMRGKITNWEIWNEQNIPSFWPDPNPTNYLMILKSAYRVLKEVDPKNRVAIGGFAGIRFPFIEELYKLGAKDFFDVMNFHLYADHNPRNMPERLFDVQIEELKGLMAKYGDGGKPFWLTETGWPTHSDGLGSEDRTWTTNVIRKALAVARPQVKGLRVGVVSLEADSGRVDPGTVSLARSELPEDCEVVGLVPDEVAAALDAGRLDVLWWSMHGWYFEVGDDAVERFLKRGGTVIAGSQLHTGLSRDAQGAWTAREPTECRRAKERLFRFSFGSFRADNVPVCRLDPPAQGHYLFGRYLTAANLHKGDVFTPVFETTDTKTGRSYPIAGVYAYEGGRAGTLIQSFANGRFWWSCTEERQAVRLARNWGLLFAEGAERLFLYEFQEAGEGPSVNPQEHFGIVSKDYSRLKPAYHAYRQFVRMRPTGSVQAAGAWHDATRTFYHPSWIRPDGKKAGMLWTIGTPIVRELDLGGEVGFFDLMGRPVDVVRSEGRCAVQISDVPVYWLMLK